MELRMKNFNIWAFTEKSDFQRGDFTKKQWGGITQKGGLGGGFWGGGGLIPQCILCFLTKLKGKGRPFLEGPKKGATLWDYPQEHMVVIREEKISPFVKFEVILHLLCFLLHLLTDKLCKAWSSMINLWIDSRTYQK